MTHVDQSKALTTEQRVAAVMELVKAWSTADLLAAESMLAGDDGTPLAAKAAAAEGELRRAIHDLHARSDELERQLLQRAEQEEAIGAGGVEPLRMASIEDGTRQKSRAWDAVVSVLDDVAPGWCGLEFTGIDSAVAAIRKMARARTTPADAMETLRDALAADPEYAWSWHCAAWACAHDEGLDADAANRAAARLMYMAFNCDTSKNKHFNAQNLARKGSDATSTAAGPAAHRTGVTADQGPVLELANSGELAFYDYAVAQHCAATSAILDGKDVGDGSNAEPWASVRSRLLELVATVAAAPIERKFICPTRTVADLANNLLLLDQALPIYGAQYIEHGGRRRAIAVSPTVSRERIKDSRWIGEGEELNAAVIWTSAEQPAAQGDALSDECLSDMEAASDALEIIAKRRRQVVDVLEPVNDIRKASRIASEGYRRIQRAMSAIAADRSEAAGKGVE